MTVRAALIVLLALMAGCSTGPKRQSPVASGCAVTLQSSDASACWLWSDAMSRASSPARPMDKPLLRDSDGGVIVGNRPAN